MDLRVGQLFRVGRRIGSGAFGEIYLGTNIESGEEVAIKLEDLTDSEDPQLLDESNVYRVLEGGRKLRHLCT